MPGFYLVLSRIPKQLHDLALLLPNLNAKTI